MSRVSELTRSCTPVVSVPALKPMPRAAVCADRFILLDNRAERYANQRYCMVLGAWLARKLGRTLVAPAYFDGVIVDPPPASKVDSYLDYFDYFAPPARLCTVRLRRFLTQYPLSRLANGTWLPAGNFSFSLQEMVVRPAHLVPKFQRDLFTTDATVMVLREPGELSPVGKLHSPNLCTRFGFFKWSPLYAEFTKPANSLASHLRALRAAVASPRQFIAVHWRATTNPLMHAIQRNRSTIHGSHSLSEHFHGCADQLVSTVQAAMNAHQQPAAATVLLFSDLDETYKEFSTSSSRAASAYARARKSAHRRLLAQPGWQSGDALVTAVIRKQGGDAGSLYPILLQDLLCRSPRSMTMLVTCTHKSCSHCARDNSAFSRGVVEARRAQGLTTVVRWNHSTSTLIKGVALENASSQLRVTPLDGAARRLMESDGQVEDMCSLLCRHRCCASARWFASKVAQLSEWPARSPPSLSAPGTATTAMGGRRRVVVWQGDRSEFGRLGFMYWPVMSTVRTPY